MSTAAENSTLQGQYCWPCKDLAHTMLSLRSLPQIVPNQPDFAICHPDYGMSIVPSDCEAAGEALLHGTDAIYYYLNRPDMPNNLPFTVTKGSFTMRTYVSYTILFNFCAGSCAISVEYAGPEYATPSFVELVPEEIRGMAGFIINKCPSQEAGMGGFVTGHIQWLVDFMQHYANVEFGLETASSPGCKRSHCVLFLN